MILDEIKNINVSQCNKFSNLAKDKLPMPGKKKRLDEILNREILVIDYGKNLPIGNLTSQLAAISGRIK